MDGKETRGNCDEVVTDNEIIKALKYCGTEVLKNTCPKCAFYKKHRCSTLMLNAVSDLINRQKTRIKEFVERLKIKVKMYNSEDVDEGDLIDDLLTVGETVEIIDRLVKEMKRGCK